MPVHPSNPSLEISQIHPHCTKLDTSDGMRMYSFQFIFESMESDVSLQGGVMHFSKKPKIMNNDLKIFLSERDSLSANLTDEVKRSFPQKWVSRGSWSPCPYLQPTFQYFPASLTCLYDAMCSWITYLLRRHVFVYEQKWSRNLSLPYLKLSLVCHGSSYQGSSPTLDDSKTSCAANFNMVSLTEAV